MIGMEQKNISSFPFSFFRCRRPLAGPLRSVPLRPVAAAQIRLRTKSPGTLLGPGPHRRCVLGRFGAETRQ
jgi:hypothetical protein